MSFNSVTSGVISTSPSIFDGLDQKQKMKLAFSDSVSSSSALPSSLSIPFPYETPYPVQEQLMQAIFQCLEEGNIGLFESPTGTGKSLSLISASLTWLKEKERKVDSSKIDNTNDPNCKIEKENKSSALSWLDDYEVDKQAKIQEEKRKKRVYLKKRLKERLILMEKYGKLDVTESILKKRKYKQQEREKKNSKTFITETAKLSSLPHVHEETKGISGDKDLQEFLMEDYESDNENNLREPTTYQRGSRKRKRYFNKQNKKQQRYNSSKFESESESDDDDDGCDNIASCDNVASYKLTKDAKNICNGIESLDKEENSKRNANPDLFSTRSSLNGVPGLESLEKFQIEMQEEEEELFSGTKIIYASRTHSQISQFVNEIKKTVYGGKNDEDDRCAKVVTLGSRQQLCINQKVTKAAYSDSMLNDLCLDLQKGLSSTSLSANTNSTSTTTTTTTNTKEETNTKTCKCPYLSGTCNEESQLILKHQILGGVQDVEEVVNIGKKLNACPYYASRNSIPLAEVICVPYATLLSPHTRESMGIPIKDNVIIIDEAHNLIDAINQCHNSIITLPQLENALLHLQVYKEKYHERLNAKNLFYVNQLIVIMERFIYCLTEKVKEDKEEEELYKYAKQSSKGTRAQDFKEKGTIEIDRKKTVKTVNDFLFSIDLDNVNFFKLLNYMEKSLIANKVLGLTNFIEKQKKEKEATSVKIHTYNNSKSQDKLTSNSSEKNTSSHTSKHVSTLSVVKVFLQSLLSDDIDGRIIIESCSSVDASRENKDSRALKDVPKLKYILLNPANAFADIVRDAYSIVLAGGTMHPVDTMLAQLFGPDAVTKSEIQEFSSGHSFSNKKIQSNQITSSSSPSQKNIRDRLQLFRCGHVIPSSNLSVFCMERGPSNINFDFRHSSRLKPEIMDELGRLVLNVCNVTPGGIVIFLPSYDYEERLLSHWQQRKQSNTANKPSTASNNLSLYEKLLTKKPIYREPKQSKAVDAILTEFSKSIRSEKNGAILLSVVGGKMSEGINFSDDLCRLVIMVGLPYPDKRDPELQEKMTYLDNFTSLYQESNNSPHENKKQNYSITGNSYYQSLCMRAVNQSIGRAIRHANDYATIMLVDERYVKDEKVRKLLPDWISQQIVYPEKRPGVSPLPSISFGKMMGTVSSFFHSKRKQDN